MYLKAKVESQWFDSLMLKYLSHQRCFTLGLYQQKEV
jgi:hypothetical protein